MNQQEPAPVLDFRVVYGSIRNALFFERLTLTSRRSQNDRRAASGQPPSTVWIFVLP